MNLKPKPLQMADISRLRSELMGIAILFVILFHVSLPRTDPFFGLRRMGNIGVDIFFFLSGVGLWFSLTSQPSLRRFFSRRYLRIYPTWFVVALLYYVPFFLKGKCSVKAFIDLLGDVFLNWDFWLNDELTFWYIPATMMLYIFAPAYIRLISRYPAYRWLPLAAVIWCVAVQWVSPIHNAVGHLEIFWSRVPIFFIGINCGEWVRNKRTFDGETLWIVLLMFLLPFGICLYLEQQLHGRFPLFIERLLYIPLAISTLILLCRLLSVAPQWLNRALRTLGIISLELYLLHAHFVLIYVERWSLPYWGTFFACLIITIPPAWMLNRAIGYITKRLEK